MNESRIRVLEHHLAGAVVSEATGGDRAAIGSAGHLSRRAARSPR